eukprot:9803693-Prorocentrum_lima.AAC.1
MTHEAASANIGGITYALEGGGVLALLRRSTAPVAHSTAALPMLLTTDVATMYQAHRESRNFTQS